jgi:predicted Zn finger-like uncharacterized protein
VLKPIFLQRHAFRRMILTCPQCATRYETDAALFGAQGRKVRCAKCGAVWQQEPPPPPAEAEPEPAPFEEIEATPPAPSPLPPPPQRVAYAPSATAFDEPEPDVAEREEPPRARVDWAGRLGVAAGWAGLAALVFVIGWSGMRFRQQIATLWPKSATLYAALGKPVNTTGLKIENPQSHNETEDGQPVLTITGRLTNITTHEIMAPPLRVTLTDADKRVLYNWSFSIGIASLKPGQKVNFLTRLQSPPASARNAEVQVAESGK